MHLQQCDGQEAMICIRNPKSWSVAHRALLFFIESQCFVVYRVALIGPRSPWLAGIPMNACHSLPWRHLRSLCGTFVQWCMVQSFNWMHLCLSLGSLMHHLTPLNIHPSNSLHIAHRPSPWSSFLSATGSSLVPLVTDGGGRTECMAYRRACDRWRSWAGLVVCVSWMKLSMYICKKTL